MVVPGGPRLLFVEPLNVGSRVWCLDRETGNPIWAKPIFYEGGAPSPQGWVVGEDVFYHTDDGHIEARSLRDGSSLWRQPFADAERARLVLRGSTLFAFARIGAGTRFGFRSPLGSLQYIGGSRLSAPYF